MRKLLASAAAILLIAAPAQAYPQWIQVDGAAFDFNSIKEHGAGIRSTVLGLATGDTARIFIHCPSWQWGYTDGGWTPLGPGSNGEVIAYAICPGSRQAGARQMIKL